MKTTKCRLHLWAALLCIPAICVPAFAWPLAFTFEIGSPVAAQDFRVKTAAFVFRTAGCAEPRKPELTAAAEGLVNGARRSMVLKVEASSKPGVYGVLQQWGPGSLAVVLNGSCGEARAGA